jgi:hypothetical protein
MIRIGSKVRSFDFDGRSLEGPRACYVEGVVIGFANHEGCDRYEIRVERDVCRGEDSDRRIGCVVIPPLNGTPSMLGGTTNFVELV